MSTGPNVIFVESGYGFHQGSTEFGASVGFYHFRPVRILLNKFVSGFDLF